MLFSLDYYWGKSLLSVLHKVDPVLFLQPCLQRLPLRASFSPVILPSHTFCKAATLPDEGAAQVSEALSRYKDKPWEYLESEGT